MPSSIGHWQSASARRGVTWPEHTRWSRRALRVTRAGAARSLPVVAMGGTFLDCLVCVCCPEQARPACGLLLCVWRPAPRCGGRTRLSRVIGGFPETTHKRDSAVVAAATDGPERCATSRSSRDYAVRGGPGDPRGRKSGAGPEAANPRLPAWAEGEKRFRSATRNPYAAMHSVA